MNIFINNQRLAQLAGVDFDSEKIKPGPIVYSRTHTVISQFSELAKFPECILITSFSDASCTRNMAQKLPFNIRRWFSNNVVTNNSRVTAVPIGVSYSLELEDVLRFVMKQERKPQRNLMYVNFFRNIPRMINPRCGLYEMFEKESWITIEGGQDHIPFQMFYEQISSHPFVLSPPGAGPDCHRHWESILLGSIPIVLKSSATRILNGLPCLQISNWNQVTEEYLLDQLPILQKRFHGSVMNKCWFEYWRERILEA